MLAHVEVRAGHVVLGNCELGAILRLGRRLLCAPLHDVAFEVHEFSPAREGVALLLLAAELDDRASRQRERHQFGG